MTEPIRKHSFTITWDEELPICQSREEIAKLIRENQVVIVCGETGSGKSTQLPKICLELGRGTHGMIGHTQPRRIAARSIAKRIADELGTSLGHGVGYKIRFTDETSDDTFVKLMTDGILLAESRQDPLFKQYDTLIIDEAHERSLNIDFLLGMLKRLLPRRRDLKVIITSATIDAKRFADHFGTAGKPAPVVEVSGRTWPVDILYRSIEDYQEEDENLSGPDLEPHERALLDAVNTLAKRDRGDILIFMPTERDIFETAKLLKSHNIPRDDHAHKTKVLPLYSRLPGESQQKIFQPDSWRKIVIATNVAESSLTVPGIRYVIDSGTARISRYSSRSKTQRLPIEAISQASANQRAGRCGRLGPGICIRLYSQQDFTSRDAYTVPEIRRTNLASVILQTKVMRLGDVEHFPFIDPPSHAAIDDGYKTLFELGAIDEEHKLTPLGHRLSRLPVDPRIGRMILAADDENVLREVLIIASALELQDPRERPHEAQEKADTAHAPFIDETSDFLSYLKLWDFWQRLKEELSLSQLRKACKTNFLSWNRMREWSDLFIQLQQIVRKAGLKLHARRDDSEAITRSILTGLLYAVSKKTDSPEYQVTGGGKFFIWPGSGLFKKKYPWVVAAERVETSKRYLRTVGKINPDWIEPLAGHLLKKTYSDPHWLRETGCVHAWERVTLYGLTIVPKRRVNYGPIDSARARELFIQHALVEEDFECRLDFYLKNTATRLAAEKLQAKLRVAQLVAEQDRIYDFYERRLPEFVYDSVSLVKWYRSLPGKEKDKLLLSLDDVCLHKVDESLPEHFPDAIETISGASLELDYRYEPGESDDGVSLVTQPEGVGQIDNQQIGWLVPGLLEQKIIAALKSLPKEIRRELVPVPDTAKNILQKIEFGQGNFFQALARIVSTIAGKRVVPDDFDQTRIPQELVMNIRVIDSKGKILAQSRDLTEIRATCGVSSKQAVTALQDPKWHRNGITRWDFGGLPEEIRLTRGTSSLTAWPGLIDPRFLPDTELADSQNTQNKKGHSQINKSESVCLRLFDSAHEASFQTRLALIRLFAMENRTLLKTQAKWLPGGDRMSVLTTGLPNFDFLNAAIDLIARRAVDPDDLATARNEGEFNHLMRRGKEHIGPAVQELAIWLPSFLEAWHATRLVLEKQQHGPAALAVSDARSALQHLFTPWFYLTTPWQRLREFPRYLKAVVVRFDRYTSGGGRQDAEFSRQLNEYWTLYEELYTRLTGAGLNEPQLEDLRWMLEEYRVSLFAQKLGTAFKVSAVRIDRVIEELRQK
ncbi:MAG: ATP-dependent RNA helicase HrpA [Planctomycetia bacterium]|nr:ATP-dependent RNA helicase HrpA [Planctomycetia bacterium]